MSNNEKSKIEDLVESLSGDLKAVKKTKHPLFFTIPWIVFAALFAVFAIHYAGIRHDISEKLHDSTFLFEISMVAVFGIFAALSSSYLMIPDMRGKKWLIPVTFTLGAIFALWNILKCVTDGLHMPHLNFDHCMKEGIYIAFIPLMALIFFLRSGATTRPVIMACMNAFAGASMAYIGLRLTCSMDTVGHATIMHLIPYIVIGSILGLISRRLYRW